MTSSPSSRERLGAPSSLAGARSRQRCPTGDASKRKHGHRGRVRLWPLGDLRRARRRYNEHSGRPVWRGEAPLASRPESSWRALAGHDSCQVNRRKRTALTTGEKAALTRKRKAAGKKAALTRKRRAAGSKAAATRKANAR